MNITDLFSKTTILLGAGASRDAKCLTSTEMVMDLKQKVELVEDASQRKQFCEIYDFIVATLAYQYHVSHPASAISGQIVNIEDFYRVLMQMMYRDHLVPRPLVGTWNERIATWEAQTPDIFKSFLGYLRSCLFDSWLNFDVEAAKSILAPWNALLALSEAFELKVFTLNYDLVLESVLNGDGKDIVIADGFSGTNWTGTFDKKLHYYKLHGSINWQFDRETESIRRSEGGRTSPDPLVIFGAENKLLSFEPFLKLLAALHESLAKTNLLIVVGYSFQDRYINSLIIQQLMNTRIARKMLVVRPETRSSKEFVQSLQEFQSMPDPSGQLGFSRLSEDLVEMIPMPAKTFYEEYFSRDAQLLKNKLEAVIKEDQVF